MLSGDVIAQCRAYIWFLTAETVYKGGWTAEIYEVRHSQKGGTLWFPYFCTVWL